jgi:predicted small metal-binding protein
VDFTSKGGEDMDTAQLDVKHGEWFEIDCRKMPSEKNCKLVMMAPADQMDDLLDAAVSHAIKTHGHKESGELRNGIKSSIEPINL